MSPAVAWDQKTALVALQRAERALPHRIRQGAAALEVSPLPAIRPASSGRGWPVPRHPVAWTDGRARGVGYVELHPAASYAVEVVLHLRGPGGLRGLLWPRRRLAATARRLLTAVLESLREAAAPDARRRGEVEVGGWPSPRPAFGDSA